MQTEPAVLALVRDLMMGSRVSAAAERLNVPVRLIRDPARLADCAGRLALVDLNEPGALDAAADWQASDPTRSTIGFVSHVDAATAARARQAGIARVVARSRFVELLPALLQPGAAHQSAPATPTDPEKPL
jgi:hypothetical protein